MQYQQRQYSVQYTQYTLSSELMHAVYVHSMMLKVAQQYVLLTSTASTLLLIATSSSACSFCNCYMQAY
jgi:hypothetical protein